LRLVGGFEVYRGGRSLKSTEIGSRKARSLLALLAVYRDRQIAADRVVEALWGADPPRQPAENVATLVSRLRAALGAEAISGGRNGYRLSEGIADDLHDSDAFVADAEARLAEGEVSSALTAARRALDLLEAGEVLAGETWAWAEEARMWHGRLLQRARRVAAEGALHVGDLDVARTAAEAALWADPLDETAGRALIRVHEVAGEPARALIVYEQLRATLARELGIDPTPATQELHVAVLRANAAPVGTDCGLPAQDRTYGSHLAALLGDRGVESDLLTSLAVLTTNGLRFDEAVGYGQQSLVAARSLAAGGSPGGDRVLAAALDGLATTYAYLGELAELAAILAELEPLLRRLGDDRLTQWSVFGSAFPMIAAGDWRRAAGRVVEALLLDQRHGSGYEPWYVAHLGWLARLAGRYDEALGHGWRAMSLESTACWSAAVPAMLATTLLETGRPAEAITLLDQSLTGCDQHRTSAYRLRCLAPLAEATGSAAVLDEADALIAGIGAPPGSAWLYGADVYVAAARAWLAKGRPGRALEILSPLLAAGERTGWRAPLAGARRLADRCWLAMR
jgi:DNA-binding SARP family transcriptional activator